MTDGTIDQKSIIKNLEDKAKVLGTPFFYRPTTAMSKDDEYIVMTLAQLKEVVEQAKEAVDTYRPIIQESFEEVIDQEIINRVTRA